MVVTYVYWIGFLFLIVFLIVFGIIALDMANIFIGKVVIFLFAIAPKGGYFEQFTQKQNLEETFSLLAAVAIGLVIVPIIIRLGRKIIG